MKEKVFLQWHHAGLLGVWFKNATPEQISQITEDYIYFLLFNRVYTKLENPIALSNFRSSIQKAARGYLTGDYKLIPDLNYKDDTICKGCAYLEGKFCTHDPYDSC